MRSIINKLNELFKGDSYFLDEKGEVIKEKIKTSAINMDDHLLSIITSDEELKSTFFVEKNN